MSADHLKTSRSPTMVYVLQLVDLGGGGGGGGGADSRPHLAQCA